MFSMINLILEHGGTLPSTMETRTHSTTTHGTTATSQNMITTAASSKSAAIALALGISIPVTGVFCTVVLTVVCCCVLYKCRQRGPPDEKPVHSSNTAESSSVYEEMDVVNASCDKSEPSYI